MAQHTAAIMYDRCTLTGFLDAAIERSALPKDAIVGQLKTMKDWFLLLEDHALLNELIHTWSVKTETQGVFSDKTQISSKTGTQRSLSSSTESKTIETPRETIPRFIGPGVRQGSLEQRRIVYEFALLADDVLLEPGMCVRVSFGEEDEGAAQRVARVEQLYINAHREKMVDITWCYRPDQLQGVDEKTKREFGLVSTSSSATGMDAEAASRKRRRLVRLSELNKPSSSVESAGESNVTWSLCLSDHRDMVSLSAVQGLCDVSGLVLYRTATHTLEWVSQEDKFVRSSQDDKSVRSSQDDKSVDSLQDDKLAHSSQDQDEPGLGHSSTSDDKTTSAKHDVPSGYDGLADCLLLADRPEQQQQSAFWRRHVQPWFDKWPSWLSPQKLLSSTDFKSRQESGLERCCVCGLMSQCAFGLSESDPLDADCHRDLEHMQRGLKCLEIFGQDVRQGTVVLSDNECDRMAKALIRYGLPSQQKEGLG